MKRIRVFAYDHLQRFLRGDEILHAEPVPKLLVSGLTWRGDLEPLLDVHLEQLHPLETGFALGHVLHAEEVPALLDLGTRWLGNFQTKLLAASADFASARRPEEAGAEPGTDVAEVVAQLDRLRRDMGTADRAKIADGVRRLRDAARRVSDSLGARRTGDGLMPRRMIGEFSTAQSVSSINDRNRRFWDGRSVTPRLDASGRMRWTGDAAPPAARTAVRDAVHAANHAATPRDLIQAKNAAAKAFWSSGEAAMVTAAVLGGAPATNSIAEMNARSRAFWAGRS